MAQELIRRHKLDGTVEEEWVEVPDKPEPTPPSKADLMAKIEELLAQVAALPSE